MLISLIPRRISAEKYPLLSDNPGSTVHLGTVKTLLATIDDMLWRGHKSDYIRPGM